MQIKRPKNQLKRTSLKRTGFKRTKKPMTITRMKGKIVWPVFSIYIRTRDCIRTTGCASWGLCISCGRRYHIKLLQAGHFISGRFNANLFHEKGCHAQCYYCNITLKGNTLAYMDAIVKLYGEDMVEKLRENDKLKIKFTMAELEERMIIYKTKTKELLELKGMEG